MHYEMKVLGIGCKVRAFKSTSTINHKHLDETISVFFLWNTKDDVLKFSEYTEIQWTVVFRSAEFAKYFIILSVNFKTFCIGFIMNTSTVNRRSEKRDWTIAQ